MNFNNVKFLTSYGTSSQLPKPSRIEIAFSGHSNVGKSSLINKIFNRKSLARVSATPGKTATINFFDFENIFIVDLPGYGYAKVSKSEKERWNKLIGGYLNDTTRHLGLVFQLVDMRHPPTKDDVTMINFLIDSEIPFVIALTKADKLSRTKRGERMEAFKTEIPCFEDIRCVVFSAETGEGADEIREIIEDIAADEFAEEGEEL
ncbi:MAG: ribosome biogenesis GTP-binding protein YihA/YsxC [Ruminococcus sp.]|nr:ribosome biogenesis GTP-binding protein YihA/YsxC [Ruminococcus sp.]MCD7773537.1 ribosome biogenesis GTP-binding protein YihA/YsxC [Ruminococcus sp.]